MNLMVEIKRSIKGTLASASLILLVLAFHNCTPSETTVTQSASTVTAPDVVPVCPYNSNPAPTLQGIFSDAALTVAANNISYRVGMGDDAGNEATRTLYLRAIPGDSISSVINVNCNDNGTGLNATCEVIGNQLRVRINPAQGAECLQGNVTIGVSVSDAVSAPGCQNLAADSNTMNLNVTLQNGCYPTTRLNPTNLYAGGQLGRSVAVDGNWAVASMPGDESVGIDSGAAYVYNFNGTTWSTFAKLVPSTVVANSALSSVAISGTTIVLASALYNNGTGRAWVYQYNGTNWLQVGTLSGSIIGERFGTSLAVAGTTIAIGAPRNPNAGARAGAVYVYTGLSTLSQTLLPFIDTQITGDVIVDGDFGASLAVSGDTLVVGAPFTTIATARKESAYIFRISNLLPAQKIANLDGNSDKRFGTSVGINGNTVIVGAPWLSAGNLIEVGRAYTYSRTSATVAFDKVNFRALNPADPGNRDHFGLSVGLNATSLLVGAPDKTFDATAKVGAVYQFNTSGVQTFKIRSRRADRENDSFGTSIGTINGWLMSGAFNDENDIGFLDSGSVYFVRLP